MMSTRHYNYRISWSVEDKEYIGLCTEFPSLSWLSADMGEALVGINRLVQDVVADMQENGESVPEPLSTKSFSGKFQVRIPPERHRALAIRAAEEGISLNRYVSDRLCA